VSAARLGASIAAKPQPPAAVESDIGGDVRIRIPVSARGQARQHGASREPLVEQRQEGRRILRTQRNPPLAVEHASRQAQHTTDIKRRAGNVTELHSLDRKSFAFVADDAVDIADVDTERRQTVELQSRRDSLCEQVALGIFADHQRSDRPGRIEIKPGTGQIHRQARGRTRRRFALQPAFQRLVSNCHLQLLEALQFRRQVHGRGETCGS
jgi:hypothetical protein